MKGRAPNCSATGSQFCVTKKAQPNRWRATAEPRNSSKTSTATISNTVEANARVTRRATSSPFTSLRQNAPAPAWGRRDWVAVTMLVHERDGFLLLGDHFFRQGSIAQRAREFLPAQEHPAQQAGDGLLLGGIVDLTGDQQPGEGGDGIGPFAGSVGNGHAEVVRHALGGDGGGLRHGLER